MRRCASWRLSSLKDCVIALAEVRRGRLAEARKYLEEARKLDPKCVLLKRAEAASLTDGLAVGPNEGKSL